MKLKPVFDRKNGTATPGNSSQVTDGAVALLVTNEERAAQLGFTPLGALTGYAARGFPIDEACRRASAHGAAVLRGTTLDPWASQRDFDVT